MFGAAWACAALAQAPLKNAGFDAKALTRENFQSTLEPLARKEGKLVFYNSAGGFDPVWKDGLIPRFTARYGVAVEYRNVKQGPANQQLIAVHRAGRDSPVDVYFAGNSEGFAVLSRAGVVAGVNLARVLPNALAVPAEYIDVVFGVATAGTWPLVHLNQTAIGYDSAAVAATDVPQSFDALLLWARKNPQKFVFTSPLKGGSGAGFLFSAARHFAQGAGCRAQLLDVRMNDEQALNWAMGSPCLAPLWNYMKALLKVAELTNGNADTLNLINNRQALMGTVWEDQTLTFQRAKLLPPSFRLTLLEPGQAASGDGLVLMANARSPAAALLFIDMALGLEFQRWKLQTHGSRSPRKDIDPQSALDADTARLMVPAEQHQRLSVPVNWRAARALAKALEDKVLAQR